MKKLLLYSISLMALLSVSCKKKKDEDSKSGGSTTTGEYYFTGTIGGVSKSFKSEVNDYDVSWTWSGIDMVSGSDTTFSETITSNLQYGGSNDAGTTPAFGLNNSYDAVGINNTVNLSLQFPIGTYNLSNGGNPEYTVQYFSDISGLCICSPDYTSKNLGTITFSEVNYLGKVDWFGEKAKEYKVKGSVDCYVYNVSDPNDSIEVVGDFTLQYQTRSY